MILTKKQSFYLCLIQQAREQGKTLQQVAHKHKIKPGNLYAASHSLKRKGYLSTSAESGKGFARVTVQPVMDACIELKTQLPNGQLIWMSVPGSQLRGVIEALSV